MLLRVKMLTNSEQNSRNERINQVAGYQANEQKLLERARELEKQNDQLKQEKTQLVEQWTRP